MNRPPIPPSQRRAQQLRRSRITLAVWAVSAIASLCIFGSLFVLFTLPDLPKPTPTVQPNPAPTGPAIVQNVHKPDSIK